VDVFAFSYENSPGDQRGTSDALATMNYHGSSPLKGANDTTDELGC